MTITEFFNKVLPLLLDHTIDRSDKELDIGKVSAYWVVNVLRVDIKPKLPSDDDF